MPADTYIAIFAAIVLFGAFAAVLAWGMWYTRELSDAFPTTAPAAKPAPAPAPAKTASVPPADETRRAA